MHAVVHTAGLAIPTVFDNPPPSLHTPWQGARLSGGSPKKVG
jgi:hypothetical protein